jgi:hypothetical protein
MRVYQLSQHHQKIAVDFVLKWCLSLTNSHFFIMDGQARPSLNGRIYFSRPRRGLGRGWELRTIHPTTIDSMVKVRPALTPHKCYISNWCVSTSRTKLIRLALRYGYGDNPLESTKDSLPLCKSWLKDCAESHWLCNKF